MTQNSTSLEKILGTIKDGFELIDDHIVVTDVEGIIVYANKAAEEKTGYKIEEMIGKKPGDLWGGKMPKEFYENMWQTIKVDKKHWSGQVDNFRKDGTYIKQELHITPTLDDKKQVICFIGIEPKVPGKITAVGLLLARHGIT